MSSSTYGNPRSRCPECRDFVEEGTSHTCPATKETKVHENPAAPKKEGK